MRPKGPFRLIHLAHLRTASAHSRTAVVGASQEVVAFFRRERPFARGEARGKTVAQRTKEASKGSRPRRRATSDYRAP
ncbi:hypothetical protein M885DRAFT_504108 [Pelagophyceae sp. CCMP2097]|nr:hypothetical protein M885DRAFT_504108 [Pelagophyceae sp. CCMP2097]